MVKWELKHGDCLKAMEQMIKDGTKIHSVICDPPYHLQSIVSRFGKPGSAPTVDQGVFRRSSTGFMGKAWDGGDIAFKKETWKLCYDLLYPGGHLLAFAATKNYHRMACAIEDAGFEIRDQIGWLYGTGFPKSHNIGGGWGTALKPAWEPICVARKPIEKKTVQLNFEFYGVGGLNIDRCRIGVNGATKRSHQADYKKTEDGKEDRSEHWARTGHEIIEIDKGRWPANVIHDGSDEVVEAFPLAKSGIIKPGTIRNVDSRKNTFGSGIGGKKGSEINSFSYGDQGSAARFFYSAKTSKSEKGETKHPTVKPVSLMRYLVKLVTPKGGTVLDPFCGTGTTLEAAYLEDINSIGIEMDDEYVKDIQKRMSKYEGALF